MSHSASGARSSAAAVLAAAAMAGCVGDMAAGTGWEWLGWQSAVQCSAVQRTASALQEPLPLHVALPRCLRARLLRGPHPCHLGHQSLCRIITMKGIAAGMQNTG